MKYTMIDSNGEILQCIDVPDDGDHLQSNTPEGATAIEGFPADSPFDVNFFYADGSWIAKPDRPSAQAKWDTASKSWVQTLEAEKASRWNYLKSCRDLAENSGFTFDGSTFDCDPSSQSRIQGAALMATLATIASQPFSIDWTLQDNSIRTLSASEMIGAGQAMATHIEAVFSQGRDLRAAIEAATTIAEVDAVAWS